MASRKWALPFPITPKTWDTWRARVWATWAETEGMAEPFETMTE
jgi:hypothetical protein